jgi:hypothetical protein
MDQDQDQELGATLGIKGGLFPGVSLDWGVERQWQ